MARIRSVHPDLCVSETMAELSADLERTFVRLWTHCDDEGRCVDNARLIKAAIYPLHDAMTPVRVEKDLVALQQVGLIVRYVAEGVSVVQVCSWGEYQHPQRATASKLPPFTAAAGVLRESSASPPRALNAGVGEGEGEGEVVGEEAGGDIRRVFEAWAEATERSKARLTDERRKRIRRALTDYPLEDVIDAVRGVALSPFHCGQNERHTRYDDIDVILRDAKHVEQFRDLWRNDRPVQEQSKVLDLIAADRARRGA